MRKLPYLAHFSPKLKNKETLFSPTFKVASSKWWIFTKVMNFHHGDAFSSHWWIYIKVLKGLYDLNLANAANEKSYLYKLWKQLSRETLLIAPHINSAIWDSSFNTQYVYVCWNYVKCPKIAILGFFWT